MRNPKVKLFYNGSSGRKGYEQVEKDMNEWIEENDDKVQITEVRTVRITDYPTFMILYLERNKKEDGKSEV